MKQLKIKRLSPQAILPTRAHSTDCGLDIYSLETASVFPNQGYTFSTGIAGEFEPGYLGMLTDRSSMAKIGLKLAGGIIDPDYRGELKVVLRNLASTPTTVTKGQRIAQLLIVPIFTPDVIEVEELSETERGDKGFGSSGR